MYKQLMNRHGVIAEYNVGEGFALVQSVSLFRNSKEFIEGNLDSWCVEVTTNSLSTCGEHYAEVKFAAKVDRYSGRSKELACDMARELLMTGVIDRCYWYCTNATM